MSATYFRDLIPEAASLPDYVAAYRLQGVDRYGRDVNVVFKRRSTLSVITSVQEIRGLNIDSVNVNMSFNDGDFFRPVAGMFCDISFVAPTYDFYFNLMDADETYYMVEVYENYDTVNERVLFKGFYAPDSYRQTWKHNKPHIHITANAGIGLLRYIKFTPPPYGAGYVGNINEGPVKDEHKMAYVLSYIFYLAGNRNDWLDMVPYNWEAPGVYNFCEVSVPVAQYYGANCIDVLDDIMQYYNTQVVQVNGMLAIRMMDEYPEVHARRYNYRGEYQDNTDIEDVQNIINLNTHTKNITGTISTDVPFKRAVIKLKKDPAGNILFNGNFEHGHAGWDDSEDMPREKYEIFGPPYRYMRMSFLNPVDYPETEIYVHNYFSRGVPGSISSYKYRVSFEAYAAPAVVDNIRIKIRLGDRVINRLITPDEWTGNPWTRFEYVFYMWSSSSPDLAIYAVKNFGNIWLYLRNIVVEAVDAVTAAPIGYVLPESTIDETIYNLNENSIRDVDVDITHFEGSRYAWLNRTPRPFLRSHNGGGLSYVSEWKVQRFSDYYNMPRRKLNIDVIAADLANINGLSLVQDVDMDITFAISSMRYSVLRKVLTIDLLQYRKYLVSYPDPPTPPPSWILANGTWNDSGEWMDTARWHDSDPMAGVPEPTDPILTTSGLTFYFSADQSGSDELTDLSGNDSQATRLSVNEATIVDDKLLRFTSDVNYRTTFSTISQPNTIISVIKPTGDGNARGVYDGVSSSTRHYCYVTITNSFQFGAGSFPAAPSDPIKYYTDELHVNYCEFNGSSSKLYVNEDVRYEQSWGTQSLQGLTIGSRFENNYYRGDIYMLAIFNRLLTESERNEIIGFLRDKYDVADTTQ